MAEVWVDRMYIKSNKFAYASVFALILAFGELLLLAWSRQRSIRPHASIGTSDVVYFPPILAI